MVRPQYTIMNQSRLSLPATICRLNGASALRNCAPAFSCVLCEGSPVSGGCQWRRAEYPSQSSPLEVHCPHRGWLSSHFSFLERHVQQPVNVRVRLLGRFRGRRRSIEISGVGTRAIRRAFACHLESQIQKVTARLICIAAVCTTHRC